jgi:transaldolase
MDMKLFADTADTKILKDLMATGMMDGVTTNPSIIAKSGRNLAEVIAEICEICPGPISAEVVSSKAEDMVAEGRFLAKIAENVVIKVPLTRDGLIATRVFTDEGLETNVTLCFSAAQALLAAKAGATYVSPFLGRLDDVGASGLDLIHQIRQLYDNFSFDTQILSASVRSTTHVTDVALAGSDCATIPPKLFEELYKHPLTDKGLEAFMADWAATGQKIL